MRGQGAERGRRRATSVKDSTERNRQPWRIGRPPGSACFHRAWRAARAMVSPEEGEGIFVIEARTIVARCLVVLALIVQIVAPTAASVAMVTATADPLAGAWICGHDGTLSDQGSPASDACRLCDLVCHGGGYAAVPPGADIVRPAAIVLALAGEIRIDDAVDQRAVRASLARGPPQNA